MIAVSFLPVFALEAQEGRLFKPLASTKNFAVAMAAVLAITLDPAMRLIFTRVKEYNFPPKWLARITHAVLAGKIRHEEHHPISRPLMKLYHPIVEFVLEDRWLTIGAAILVMVATIPIYNKLGSEFMPSLDEGTLLYMPTTLPGISVPEATRILQQQDKVLGRFPEVERVFGKAGRAESATDPAPYSMMETGSAVKTSIILLALLFSAIGAIWLTYWLGYNMSVAIWVGLIALLGVDAETAVFMLLYLDLAYHKARDRGRLNSWDDRREAIVNGSC